MIAVDVSAHEARDRRAPVDAAARHRPAELVVVFPDRIDHRPDGGAGPERLRAFHGVPAVVAPLHDQVDLLPGVLADIGRPEPSGGRIEGDLPGVPQPGGVDLAAGPRAIHERVVGRDGIAAARLAAIDVDPQDLAEQHVEPLAVAEGIVAAATVTEAHVEQAVGPEGDRTAVVVPEGLFEGQYDLGARRVGPVGIVLRDPKPRHVLHPLRARRGVAPHAHADEELAVLLEPRVEGEAEQALLVPFRPRRRAGAEIEEQLRLRRPRADHVDHAALIGHEQPPCAVSGGGHEQRPQRLGRLAVVGFGAPAVPRELREGRHGRHRKLLFVGPRRRRARCQLADLDRAKCHLIAVILEAEVALLGLTEPGKRCELALRHPLVPVLRSDGEAVVGHAIEADLAVPRRDADREVIPGACRAAGIDDLGGLEAGRPLHLPRPRRVQRLIELIEPAGLLLVLAAGVVDDLHLGTGLPRMLRILGHVEHQAAVATGADPIFELELETPELGGGHEVARGGTAPDERPILDDPAVGHARAAIAAEARGRTAVEHQPPAAPPLGLGERVGGRVGDGRGGPRSRQHRREDRLPGGRGRQHLGIISWRGSSGRNRRAPANSPRSRSRSRPRCPRHSRRRCSRSRPAPSLPSPPGH